MTNEEILDDFRSKYKIPLADYRPLCVDFVKDMEGITIWTDEGDAILYFPKQRPIGRWTPCAKSLPPSGRTACFVTVECYGEKSTRISIFDYGAGWSNLDPGERVVAWMKLPDPYREEVEQGEIN